MIDLTTVLNALSRKRPIFHSEADFQHALAWGIHEQWPACSIRLELAPPHLENRIHLDIRAVIENVTLAIELKYKTRALHVKVAGETFDLKDQSAQDIGRYDFLQDIQRLEQIVCACKDTVGYAILLTNDSLYWKPPTKSQTVDARFRIHEGRTIKGELIWSPRASKGTKRGREDPIVIKGIYRSSWQDYSDPSGASYGKFRYLLVEVESRDKP